MLIETLKIVSANIGTYSGTNTEASLTRTRQFGCGERLGKETKENK